MGAAATKTAAAAATRFASRRPGRRQRGPAASGGLLMSVLMRPQQPFDERLLRLGLRGNRRQQRHGVVARGGGRVARRLGGLEARLQRASAAAGDAAVAHAAARR